MNQLCENIKYLVDYAEETGLLDPVDRVYAVNGL